MEGAIFIARLILAGLFVVAAGAKLIDRERFRKSLRDFGVALQWTRVLIWLVPLSELSAAALLVTAPSVGAIATLILLLAFTSGISYNIVLGRQPECSCFGQIGSSTIGTRTVVRNSLLTLLAAVLVIESPSLLQAHQRTLLVLVLMVVAIAVTLFALVYEFARRQEGLSRQIEDLQEFLESGSITGSASRATTQPPRELPLGAPAPSFMLNSVGERELSIGDLLSAGKPLVLFFLSSDCAPCSALLPEINLWRHELDSQTTFAIVSKGSIESNRTRYTNAKLDSTIPVLADEDGDVAKEYRVKWTPSAISVNREGSVASQLAVGDKQIRSLLDHLTFSPSMTPWFSTQSAEGEGDGAVPRIGEPSPVAAVSDANGCDVNLASGEKTLLLFWGPNCGYCQEMLGDLREWERSRSAGTPRLLVVSRGNAETHDDLLIDSPVVFDQDMRISRAFGTPGTPSAIIIDGEGRVASALGAGADGVLALAGYRRKSESAR